MGVGHRAMCDTSRNRILRDHRGDGTKIVSFYPLRESTQPICNNPSEVSFRMHSGMEIGARSWRHWALHLSLPVRLHQIDSNAGNISFLMEYMMELIQCLGPDKLRRRSRHIHCPLFRLGCMLPSSDFSICMWCQYDRQPVEGRDMAWG